MRFHMGVSFRLKSLKKFIIPLLVGLLAYLFSSGILSVSAVEQDPLIINTTNVQDLEICGKPLTDYINYFEQYTSDKYDFVVSTDDYTNIRFKFYPKYYDNIYFSVYQYGDNLQYQSRYLSFKDISDNDTSNMTSYQFSLNNNSSMCNNIDFLDNVNAQAEFLDLMETYYNFRNDPNTTHFPSINSTNLRLSAYPNLSLLYYVSNDNRAFLQTYLYDYITLYSSSPIYYDNTIQSWYPYNWGETYVVPPVIYNGRTLSNEQQIDFNYFPPRTFDNYSKINSIYVYDNVSNLSSLSLDFTYQPLDTLYSTAIYPYIYEAYGLVADNSNSDTVYFFDRIDTSSCTLSYNTTHNNSSNTLHIGSFTCSNNIFSNYSKVSLRIVFVYDNYNEREVDQRLISYSMNHNSLSAFVRTGDYNFQGSDIYFPINDDSYISSTYKFFVSTSDSYTKYGYAISSDRNTNFIYYKLDTQELINPIYNTLMWDNTFITFDYGLSINKGVIIASDPNYTQTYNLKLFIPNNTYISISSDDNFCYYGSNGIVCNNFIIQYDNTPQDDNYNIDSYFNIVTNFIDGLSTDMVNFGEIVQQVYDTIPSFISSFIVVLYILGNAYIVYRLINRR